MLITDPDLHLSTFWLRPHVKFALYNRLRAKLSMVDPYGGDHKIERLVTLSLMTLQMKDTAPSVEVEQTSSQRCPQNFKSGEGGLGVRTSRNGGQSCVCALLLCPIYLRTGEEGGTGGLPSMFLLRSAVTYSGVIYSCWNMV